MILLEDGFPLSILAACVKLTKDVQYSSIWAYVKQILANLDYRIVVLDQQNRIQFQKFNEAMEPAYTELNSALLEPCQRVSCSVLSLVSSQY